MKRTSKLWIAGAFVLAGAMLSRLAWLIITNPFSVAVMIIGVIFFLGGIIYFASNFRDRLLDEL